MTSIDFIIERVTGEKIPRFCVRSLARARTLVLSHVLRFQSWLDFNQAFEDLFGVRWTYADREVLMADPLVMRHLRFVLYSVVYHHGTSTVANLREAARRAGLDAHDEPLLRLCRERLLHHFEEFRNIGYQPLTLQQFDAELSRTFLTNARFVAGYSWTHLRFLTHWNLSMDHIQADLGSRAIGIITEMYPKFKNPDHLRTVYRSVVQQLGLKMIKRYRSNKRSIMDSQNFKSCVSLDARIADGELDLHTFIGDSSHEMLEVRAEIAGLVARLSELDYGPLLVRLLCGEHTDDFEQWMRDEHKITKLDTYSDQWPSHYLKHCLSYCGVDSETFRRKVGHGLICTS